MLETTLANGLEQGEMGKRAGTGHDVMISQKNVRASHLEIVSFMDRVLQMRYNTMRCEAACVTASHLPC